MPDETARVQHPRRRGRPAQISVDDIVVAVLGRSGAAWTVASVAAELGVTDAAIYRYFPSRKAILAAVADRVFADVPVPEYKGDIRSFLSELGRSWYLVFVRNPSFLDLDDWAGVASSVGLKNTERTLGELLRAGYPPSDAPSVLGVLTASSREYARLAVLSARDERPDVDLRDYPTLTSVVEASTAQTVEEAFQQALSLAVEGAAALLRRRGRPQHARPGRDSVLNTTENHGRPASTKRIVASAYSRREGAPSEARHGHKKAD